MSDALGHRRHSLTRQSTHDCREGQSPSRATVSTGSFCSGSGVFAYSLARRRSFAPSTIVYRVGTSTKVSNVELMNPPMTTIASGREMNSQDSACLLPFDYRRGRNTLSSGQTSALRLRNAELAFLSACETARGRIDLADEPIQLSSASQQAGDRQVVATCWPIDGNVASRVALRFYTNLRGDADGTAYALHDAVRAAREQHDVFHWASFIHSGV
jgi:CHAT domain-containing protein